MPDLKHYVSRVAGGAPLPRADAEAAFEIIMSGEATPAQIGAFLMALRVRGETVDEITGAVTVLRGKMTRVEAPAGAIDIVGTGGDASGTFNISTASALVLAGAGVAVAKHGNRALTSRSGAADVLAALGVNIELGPEAISRCITEAGVGFMFAPMFHSSFRHVGPARAELGTRTVFNLLGPLCNPASVASQVIGVFDGAWAEPLAHVLRNLGAESIWIVHGSDGLDELTTTGPTQVAQLKDGEITSFEVTPEDAGLARAVPEALKGGDAETNAAAIRRLLAGEAGAFRDIVLLNAGAGLIVAGRAGELKEAAALAAEAIDSGAALTALERLVAASNTG
jgi:anthranilate phosphoribosyltransferase